MTTGFQQRVNNQLPVAVEGDFASVNPNATLLSIGGGAPIVAAGQTVRVGYFAWLGADGQVYSSKTAADAVGVSTLGFVGRQANAPNSVITTFLGETSMVLNAGMPCTLFADSDFWVNIAAGIAVGSTVYATAASGAPTGTSSGNVASNFKIATAQSLAPAVTAATTTIAVTTGIMTIATVSSGVVAVGQQVTGTGVPANTFITAQLSGTAGGAGTYQTTSVNRAAVAAFTATMTQGELTKMSSRWTAG